jgi:endonuclease/exonuclease/phosphatase family metal-dependent hydrolase
VRVPVVALAGLVLGQAACSSPAPAPLTLLTINIANGAGAAYRTPDNRARQAAFVASTGANVVGMEEVDFNVDRSSHADTGAEVVALPCTVVAPEFSPDGVRRCDGDKGSYLFAIAIRGDDTYQIVDGQPIGIEYDGGTDRSHDAASGVGVGVLGFAVSDAYAVILPTAADQPADEPLFAALGASDAGSPARAQLADRNLSLRMQPALDPRVALVVRIERPGAAPLSIIETHTEISEFPDIGATQLTTALAIARSERSGPPARRIALMGDFNLATVGRDADLQAIGLRRALDASVSEGDREDQLWVDSALRVSDTHELPTMGVTDHAVAVRTTIQ